MTCMTIHPTENRLLQPEEGRIDEQVCVACGARIGQHNPIAVVKLAWRSVWRALLNKRTLYDV